MSCESDNKNAFDILFLWETCEEFREILTSIDQDLANFFDRINLLTDEIDIRRVHRKIYYEITERLWNTRNSVSGGIEEVAAICSATAQATGIFSYCESPANPSLNTIQDAIAIIKEINATEQRVNDALKSARESLFIHATHELFDWSSPFKYEFFVTFNPGPDRRFYENCGEDGESMRLKIRPPSYDRGMGSELDNAYNWNIFKDVPNHPLREGYHGYLVYCLLEHVAVPWQLLSEIKEIDVKLSIEDYIAAWSAP